jgi:antitoxin YefM
MAETVSYSELRETLKACLDKVCNDHKPLFVKRQKGENVVIMSSDDYAALEETAYLLQSPANAAKLMQALNRNPKDQIVFDDTEALKNDIGL